MARVLGYGGIANTNGARSFAGKTAQVSAGGGMPYRRRRYTKQRQRPYAPYGLWVLCLHILGGLI